MNIIRRLTHLNRQTVYTIVAIAIIVPLIKPLRLPEKITPPVKSLYDFIESLPEGSTVLLSIDYAPDVLPETHPMAYAVLRHCFLRGIRVIGISLNPAGVGLGLEVFEKTSRELNKKKGRDWAYLGFKPNLAATILGLGEEIRTVFPVDYYGTPLDSMPMFRFIHNYNDISLVVSFAGSAVPEAWIRYANARYKANIAAGVTGVMAADFYPYLQTGQLIGLLAGMKGAAEYETLVEKLLKEKGFTPPPLMAVRGMDAVSISHLVIILLVILGNIGFYVEKRRKE